MTDHLDLLRTLGKKLDDQSATLNKLDRYYTGDQPVAFIPDEVRRLVGRRLFNVVLNFAEMALESLGQRLDVEGFRLGGAPEANDELWELWQANDMDEESPVLHDESMLYGYSAVSVWAHEDDETVPVYSVESPHQVAFDYDPATRQRRASLKRWVEGDEACANLFLPDGLLKYRTKAGVGGVAPLEGWVLADALENPMGAVAMVPYRNKPRTKAPDGRSEIAPLLGPADAINKLATDLMVTADFHATPRRFMTNLMLTTNPGERERLRQEVTEYVDLLSKGRTLIGGQGTEFGQLAAADLSNFTGSIRMFVGFFAALAAMPPHEVGITTENPASAEAIRSSETLKVKRAERKQRVLGGSHEDVQRLGVAVKRGVKVAELPSEFFAMETIWRDAATPTVAQAADAAVKLKGAEIIDDETAQEMVGIGPTQRSQIKGRRDAAAAQAAVADVEARVALARRLQEEDGLSQNAALAAAGLLAAAAANAAT